MFQKIITILLLFLSFCLFAQDDFPHLIAHYPFDGDTKDYGSANFGYTNSEIKFTNDRFGNKNKAAQFNGLGSFILINDNQKLLPPGNFSICGWFKIDSLQNKNNTQILLSKYNLTGDRSLKLQVKNTDKPVIAAYLYEDAKGQNLKKVAQKTIQVSAFGDIDCTYTWQHFCLTFDENLTLKLYLNGVLANESNVADKQMHIANAPLVVGVQYSSYEFGEHQHYFKGALDDLRFYYGALNECAVNELYFENNETPAERIKNFVNNDLNTWQQIRPDELPEQHEKRLTDSLDWRAWKLERILINRIKKEIMWKCGSHIYNNNEQTFELKFKHCQPINIEVSNENAEAKSFKDNFKNLEVTKSRLSLTDNDLLEVECLEFYNPQNQQTYTYGNCKAKEIVFFTDTTTVDVDEEQKRYKGRKISVLETIEVKSKKVTIEVWDDRREDGDIIGLVLNDIWVLQGYEVTNEKKVLEFELKKGNNKLVMFARNQGVIPPNTAVLQIDDGVRKQKVWLRSDFKNSGAINIKVK